MAYTNVREAFKVMLAGFDPDEAEGLEVVYQINISGEDGGQWYLKVDDGECEMKEGVHPSPHLLMNMSPETCLKWMNKEASGAKLFMSGEIESQGNVMLAPKIDDMFDF